MSFEMITMRRVCSILTMYLLFLQPVRSQYNPQGLDEYLLKNQKAFGGQFAALIYSEGKVIYQKATGEFNAKTQVAAADAAKWLTAALVMTFVDQGKISLDDPVSRYIPSFEKYMKNYVTIRHCLAHATGIENEASKVGRLLTRKKFASLEEEINAIAAKEISANPGEQFHYGNIGLNIAGRVLEIVSKKSFDRLIQEKLLRPLKMRATNFVDDEGGSVNPSSGVKTTANDYINFLSMLLNKGMFEGKKILSEESIAEMQKPQFTSLPVKYLPKEVEGMRYGLGLWIDDSTGETAFTSPSLTGTWPFIDKCRKYAFILLVQNPVKEDKKQTFLQMKQLIDEQLPCR